MNVYFTYAHRPMVRTFDFNLMSFIDENILTRDLHPPMDSESSYVMLNFDLSFQKLLNFVITKCDWISKL